MDSFALSALDLLNFLQPKVSDPAFASKRPFIDQASGIVSATLTHRPVEDIAKGQIEGLAEEYGVNMDRDTLIVILDDMLSVALSGSNTANLFAQSVANASSNLPQYLRDEWGGFADIANRLSDDIGKLGSKIKTAFGHDQSWYIPGVRRI